MPMKRAGHRIFLFTMGFITVASFLLLAFYGADYYKTSFQDRFYHRLNESLKPSGIIGHGLGVAGSLLMLSGVFFYMARKRIRRLSQLGTLKHWLEFHIFLCTLGPILVLYHTAFKFGGLVAISFWSMVAVVISGVIGRFIYLQIPHTIEGREMNLNELGRLKSDIFHEIEDRINADPEIISYLNEALVVKSPRSGGSFFSNIRPQLHHEKNLITQISLKLKSGNITLKEYKTVMSMVKREIVMNRRIAWLSDMQDFLRYWHVAHLPFALVMLVIMIVHVIVAVVFGYRWIF
jgi:hypothetical protein